MGDLRIERKGAEGQEGTVEYHVSGLLARRDVISSGAGALHASVLGRLEDADAVVAGGQGPYAVMFANEGQQILFDLAVVYQRLRLAVAVCDAYPADVGAATDAGPETTLPAARPGPDVAASQPALDAFVLTCRATDSAVGGWAASCSYDGVSLATWRVDADGALQPFDDGVGLPALVGLPSIAALGEAAGTRAAAFTEWVALVAERFRATDHDGVRKLVELGGAAGYSQGLGPDAGGARCGGDPIDGRSPCEAGRPCALYGYCPLRSSVIDPGSAPGDPDFVIDLDGARVYTPDEWAWLFRAQGIDGEVPLHFSVHGYMQDGTNEAGEVDALYPSDGDAVVIAVNWPAGDEPPTPWGFSAAFGEAEGDTSSNVAAMLGGATILNPTAMVAITGHSLGGKVTVEALAKHEQWLRDDQRHDQLTLNVVLRQAAIEVDDPAIDVLKGDLVDTLTITVNREDQALWVMEQFPQYGDALGDEAGDDPHNGLAAIVSARPDGTTIVVDHRDEHGGTGSQGHLGDSPIADVVLASQVDAVAGDSANPALDLLVTLGNGDYSPEEATRLLNDPDVLARLDHLRETDQPWPDGDVGLAAEGLELDGPKEPGDVETYLRYAGYNEDQIAAVIGASPQLGAGVTAPTDALAAYTWADIDVIADDVAGEPQPPLEPEPVPVAVPEAEQPTPAATPSGS